MTKVRVSSSQVGEPPGGTWSNCLVAEDHVYIAGVTARGDEFDDVPGGSAYDQTVIILRKIKLLMEAAGGCIDDVVRVVIYRTDIDDRDAVWKARREFFSGDFPVPTLFEVSQLVRPEMRVEIEADAILGASEKGRSL